MYAYIPVAHSAQISGCSFCLGDLWVNRKDIDHFKLHFEAVLRPKSRLSGRLGVHGEHKVWTGSKTDGNSNTLKSYVFKFWSNGGGQVQCVAVHLEMSKSWSRSVVFGRLKAWFSSGCPWSWWRAADSQGRGLSGPGRRAISRMGPTAAALHSCPITCMDIECSFSQWKNVFSWYDRRGPRQTCLNPTRNKSDPIDFSSRTPI